MCVASLKPLTRTGEGVEERGGGAPNKTQKMVLIIGFFFFLIGF